MTVGRSPAWIASALMLLALGCGDDAHKGTISHGSAPPPQIPGAPPPKQGALRLDPGTPLMAAPVAKRLRVRLAALGLTPQQVRIDGAEVEADVPADKLAQARAALLDGHLDILLAETERDLLVGADGDQAAKRFTLKEDTVAGPKGDQRNHYLSSKPSERDALSSYLQLKLGPRSAVGPLFDGKATPQSYRSYGIQDGRIVRGEHILSVTVQERDGTISLRTTFTPAATAGLRWHIKHGTRFLFYADHDVLSAVTPKALDEGDSLTFVYPSHGTAAATRDAAETVARRMNGLSLSHRTKLVGTN